MPGGTTPLPTPDATGTIAMSATAAKVVLVTHQTTLTCGITCGAADGVHDLVGYGGGQHVRDRAGAQRCRTPRRRAGTRTAPTPTTTRPTSPSARRTRRTPDPEPPPPPPVKTINEIQGAAHRSPLEGLAVADVHGVVTAKRNNGFWMQDPAPDADPATSDGLFVFTSSTPTVNVGDDVLVDGTVAEFRPGNDPVNLTTTELTAPQRADAVPPASAAGDARRARRPDRADRPSSRTTRPATWRTRACSTRPTDGIDFYESLEGMHLELQDAVAVGPRSGFGEIPVLPAGGAGAGIRTNRGGILLRVERHQPGTDPPRRRARRPRR